MLFTKNTKIICTIGPASESEETLRDLMTSGMNICRLNFSHGDYEEHGQRIQRIRKVASEVGKNIGILLDTKGPEIRLGEFENGSCDFEKDDIVTICKEEVLGNHERFHIQCKELFDDVSVGGCILMDDGKMKVTILEKNEDTLVCRVENPHTLKSKKGCNVPNVKLTMPFISKKDENDIRFGCRNDVDFIAASFTRRKQDILDIRAILRDEFRDDVKIIAKIENQEGYDNLDEILEVSDGVMVARGDLGVDVSLELVPIYQKAIIRRANELGKPVITATHMLESMQGNPRPTRAEASDVANAILDGTDAIMLSGESAAGMYPVESVQTMVKIAVGMEPHIPYAENLQRSIRSCERTKEDAIAIASVDMALTIDIKAIVVFTQSGASARRLSKYRPNCPIFAITHDERTQHQLAIYNTVHTIVSDEINNPTNEVRIASQTAKRYGVQPGEHIIMVAGYPTGIGATNVMRIIEVQ